MILECVFSVHILLLGGSGVECIVGLLFSSTVAFVHWEVMNWEDGEEGNRG